jgi:hypothetical protein
MFLYLGWNTQATTTLLYLPAGTDIRLPHVGGNGDIVEVPSGSGLYWAVQAVGDVAKGFSNEYRAAALLSFNLTTGGWVLPQP